MYHKPIRFEDLSLIYPHKICFQEFSGEIRFGQRIALIGSNGAGKSTLLNMLRGHFLLPSGAISIPKDVRIAYVPQIIDERPELSGGQRFNHLLTQVLSENPNVLLLDEPTNHLDRRNRSSLLRMLQHYTGTLIIATHDTELIHVVGDTLWHIDQGSLTIFNGGYLEYLRVYDAKRAFIDCALTRIAREKKAAHKAVMQEQERAKRTRIQGEKKIAQRKWPTVRSHTKLASASTMSNQRLSRINQKKELLLAERSSISVQEVIKPKFKLNGLNHSRSLLSIHNASIAYESEKVLLEGINFQVHGCERVALHGDNASGKSSFIRAILGDNTIKRTGEWSVPYSNTVGYLDQHYQQLNLHATVLELLKQEMSHASHAQLRTHLNDFLFRKNEEVGLRVHDLSGGEKVRLSLALIAANPPKLLILDEVTNNIDLPTRAHLIELLKAFPGAMLVISHDYDFLESIHIDTQYQIVHGTIHQCHVEQTKRVHHD